jgi:Uma2 family endonuclease
MNIQQRHPGTPDEFLLWNEHREGKREFVRGRVLELMINVTRNHVDIATNLATALRQQLDRSVFSVGSADFGVRTLDGIRYPDVFVDRKTTGGRGSDLAAVEPLFVAEVLSPSSFARDFLEKMADYRGIPSLAYYLILSHQERRVWLSVREAGRWLDAEELEGVEAILDLPAVGARISLDDIYNGVDL